MIESAVPVAARVARGSETILLVEDEPDLRRLARIVLETNGYRVLEAAAGEEAIQQCRHCPGPIDLLLTDVVMPGLSGRQLAEQIRSLRPGLRTLFMSGYTDDTVVRHGLVEGSHVFLQ